MGTSSQTLNTNIICELKQMADMDGDGRQDVVAFGNDGLFVSLNKGSYFEKATKWTSEFSKLTGWDPSRNSRQIVDVNNDGLPDVVCIAFYIFIINFIKVKLVLSTSTQFQPARVMVGRRIGTGLN